MSETSPIESRSSDSSIRVVLDDPSISFWLKDALAELLKRAPLDALQDAQLLAALMETRLLNVEQDTAGAMNG